ncbi:MAG: hypothetical protein IH899_10905 [Planctomycetes bacterium]|nr:hypothetical protein [Planctomycetota bacterium]
MNQIHLEKLKRISRLGQRLWTDSSGFVVSGEYILLTTILVIGMIVGVVTFRDQVVQEFGDIADAMESLDQSYTYSITIPDPNDPNQRIVIESVNFDEDNPPDPPSPPGFPDPTGESFGPGAGQPPAGILFLQEPATVGTE